ncbi:transcriptional regulator, IclR family [Variovorax paradoxus B4]|uniref:HTH-type transcriptional regulator KipR n=2 Tax=Variovorax paradoxus TaxID=34073 RepID=A0A0H2LQQ4_VARPD|nr:helix-turn-helix domain-containing protein [Variovorax paradoxus]AGU53539.1 transcriptional regulator, IclR family [Variovorax paradoxus B4]KLN52643.1 HTH-type transcriptional regulator KipR [Variovorax paradoxus]
MNDTDNKDRQFATTLASGIDLLLCFHPGESSLANKDFAQRTGLSKPTVARLTHTLALLGYLRRDPATASYRLGAAVLGLSHPLLASMRIRPIARPMMETLAREIEGAVSLGLRHRIHMVYVETARSSEDFVLTPDIGAPLPMLATAIGRAWLARAAPEDRLSVLNQIRVAAPAEFERHAAAAELAREELARDGFCSARADWQPNRHGFAVPLHGLVDGMQFVLNCAVATKRGSFAQMRRDVAPRLLTLAHSIEFSLGLR